MVNQMKRKIFKKTAAFLLASGILAVSAAGITPAYQFGYSIDVEAMKEAEQASDFPVQVVLKKVVEECIDTETFMEPCDVLAFTVRNDSEDTITGITLKFVAYDEANETADVSADLPLVSANSSPEINELKEEGLTLEPGQEYTLATAVNYSRFVGARAMIASYTNEAGEQISNPDYPSWENLAFGLSGGNVTELD